MIDFCFIVYMSFETLNKNKYRFRSLYPFSDKVLVIYECLIIYYWPERQDV